jgi:hypothetical protein
VPLSEGGEHSYANMACAHRRCKMERQDQASPFGNLMPVENLLTGPFLRTSGG